MSMWTAVTAQVEGEAELPCPARLIALWNVAVDGEHQMEVDGDRVRIRSTDAEVDVNPDGVAYVQYSDRWQTEGLRALAQRLTASVPGVMVTVEEEWTGEEPGVTRERWQHGRVTGIRTSDGDLQPVDEMGRTPDAALASILSALGALGDALMMVFPGESFWEQFSYVEGTRLAEVFEAAAMPDRAAMILDRCREADLEVWQEAAANT